MFLWQNKIPKLFLIRSGRTFWNRGQIVRQGRIMTFNEIKANHNLNDSCVNMWLQQIEAQYSNFTNVYLSFCSNMGKGRQQWEHDPGKHLPPEQWSTLIPHTNYSSKCARYKLIQMKILHRSCFTPYKRNKINPDMSDLCWYGCGKRGSLIRMLWHCPEIKTVLGRSPKDSMLRAKWRCVTVSRSVFVRS